MGNIEWGPQNSHVREEWSSALIDAHFAGVKRAKEKMLAGLAAELESLGHPAKVQRDVLAHIPGVQTKNGQWFALMFAITDDGLTMLHICEGTLNLNGEVDINESHWSIARDRWDRGVP